MKQVEIPKKSYESNSDNVEFSKLYGTFAKSILELINLNDKNIKFMVKTKKSSIWMLKGICDVLTFGPIHRLNALQCLTLEQKDKNPIEAGFSYLHQARVVNSLLASH